MCDPLSIAGIVLTVGSTVANTIGANQARKARDDALAAERIRQRQLDQEAEAINLTSQDRYQDIETQQGDKTSSLTDYYTEQPATAAPEPEFLPQSGSDLVLREETAQRQAARDFTNQQGENLARMRSFGELLGGIGREQARDAGLIGQIGGFKQGSSNVLPLELDAAAQKGAGMRFLGDLLGMGGGVAMNAGLSGAKLSNPFNRTGLPRTAPIPTPRPSNLVSLYG